LAVAAQFRIRDGEWELECSADEAFLAERLPALVAELLALKRAGGPPVEPPPVEPPPPVGPPTVRVTINGTITDYWSGAPVPGAEIRLDPLTATSVGDGNYVLDGDVIEGSYANGAMFVVTNPDRYVDTFSLSRPPLPTEFQASIVARADLARQYTLLDLSMVHPTHAAVIVELLDADRAPLEMVPYTDLTLTPITGGLPVGVGPAFFGPTGDVLALREQTVSRAENGRARAAFLDVPRGDYYLTLLTSRDGAIRQAATYVNADSNVTLCELVLSD
jgi:hypothetical protein